MPAPDTIHDAVKNALIKDGWTITHDPYVVDYGLVRVYADLAAERSIAAECAGRRIAVEIKSFLGPSLVNDFEGALGQFLLYRTLLAKVDRGREVHLAIPVGIFNSFMQRKGIQLIVHECELSMIGIDVVREEISIWTE